MEEQIQGYLADQNTPPPPQDRRRTIGIGLRKGPRGVRFLVSEVPSYTDVDDEEATNRLAVGGVITSTKIFSISIGCQPARLTRSTVIGTYV
jgi:hypothetical protein